MHKINRKKNSQTHNTHKTSQWRIRNALIRIRMPHFILIQIHIQMSPIVLKASFGSHTTITSKPKFVHLLITLFYVQAQSNGKPPNKKFRSGSGSGKVASGSWIRIRHFRLNIFRWSGRVQRIFFFVFSEGILKICFLGLPHKNVSLF